MVYGHKAMVYLESICMYIYIYLVGGLEHFLIIIRTDELIFSEGLKPPSRYNTYLLINAYRYLACISVKYLLFLYGMLK